MEERDAVIVEDGDVESKDEDILKDEADVFERVVVGTQEEDVPRPRNAALLCYVAAAAALTRVGACL